MKWGARSIAAILMAATASATAPAAELFSPEPAKLARQVADRIVAETTFAFAPELPGADDEGFYYIDFADSLRAAAGGLYFARADIAVGTDEPADTLPGDKLATARFGISHSAGAVEVRLDGKVIYAKTTKQDHFPVGHDYDRYDAGSYVAVDLAPGSKHTLAVRMLPGKADAARIWLGFFGKSGATLSPRLKVTPAQVKDAPEMLHFIVAGPVPAPKGIATDHPLGATTPDFSGDYEGADGQPVRWDVPRIHLQRKHADKLEYADWRYFTGAILDAMYSVTDTFDSLDYQPYINRHLDFFLEKRPLIERERADYGLIHSAYGHYFRFALLDDAGIPALPFADRFLRRFGAGAQARPGDADYDLAHRAAEHVMNNMPRFSDGTIGRLNPVPLSIWADDMYMGASILIRMGEATGNQAYWDEAARQVLLIDKHLYDPATSVYWHGKLGEDGPHTTSKWARANGWTIMAKTDILLALDKGHKDYPALLAAYKRHAEGLLKFQSSQGRWHQVLDNSDTYLETSASAMFIRAFAEGVRNDWLDETAFLPAIEKGWKAVAAEVREDGMVKGIVKGTPILFSDDAYDKQPVRLNDPRGLGAFLHMTVSVERLQRALADGQP